jgi:hypothetical protein
LPSWRCSRWTTTFVRPFIDPPELLGEFLFIARNEGDGGAFRIPDSASNIQQAGSQCLIVAELRST